MLFRTAMLYTILASLLIFEATPIRYVNTELLPYYNKFMDFTTQICTKDKYFYPNKIYIGFSSLKGNVIGECSVSREAFYINIKSDYWFHSKDSVRESLMFHEMTHCVLKMDHVDDRNNYMNPEINEDLTKEQIEAQLIQNLNKRCK